MNDPTEIATRRYVEHVMGMPISLALRGRHADTAAGRAAWVAVMAELAQVDRVFSTYRPDSVISRLDRGEIGLEECPAEVHEVLDTGRRPAAASGGAFSIYLPTGGPESDGRRHLDPSGVVKGWAADRASAHLAALDDTDFCLSAGGDIVCRACLDRDAVADRDRGSARSHQDRRGRPSPRRRRRHLRHHPSRRPPRRRPDRPPAAAVSRPSPSSGRP